MPPHAGPRLRKERAERGLSRPELARLILAALPESERQRPSVKDMAQYIGRWETGRVPTVSNRYQRAYAAALGVDRRELFSASFPAPAVPPADERSEKDPGSAGSVVATFEVSPGIEDDVDRRQALQAAGAVTAGIAAAPVLTVLAGAWQASQPRISGASVSRAMIEDWALGFEIHRRSYATDPPEIALGGLARDWADMAPHLAADQPNGVRRDLAHVAAQYAYLIAMGFHQINDLRMAARWWKTAHSHADVSGDSLLSSRTRSWETTYRVVETGENLPALFTLARQAREQAGHRPSGALIQAIRVEAEVLARMGRYPDAIIAIRQAEDVFERMPAGEPAERNLRFGQSLVYSLAGAQSQATEAQDAAHRLYPHESTPHTSVQLGLHRVMLHARTDPGEACRQASAILDKIPANRRVKRVVLAARRVTDAVPEDAHSLPAVRDLRALT